MREFILIVTAVIIIALVAVVSGCMGYHRCGEDTMC